MCAKRVRDPYAPPQPKSPEKALSSLMALCAKAEKSSGDARRLMTRWGVDTTSQDSVLAQLQRDRFIDDDRFASLFIREKTRLNGWGVYKIRAELQRKGISRDIIDEKLSELDRDSMGDRLAELVAKRVKSVKYNSIPQLRDKLIRYGASLGYDFQTVSDCVREAIAHLATEEEEEVF
ncbi:MAG: regulatory protein RecX [Rikenellaceae bacterium]